MSLTGLTGILLSEGVDFNPVGLKGILFTFSDDTIFVNVKNGLGKPIVGMEVSTPFNSTTLTGFTDSTGSVQMLCDASGTITFKKDKTFRSKAYDRVTEGNLVSYVYNVPMME